MAVREKFCKIYLFADPTKEDPDNQREMLVRIDYGGEDFVYVHHQIMDEGLTVDMTAEVLHKQFNAGKFWTLMDERALTIAALLISYMEGLTKNVSEDALLAEAAPEVYGDDVWADAPCPVVLIPPMPGDDALGRMAHDMRREAMETGGGPLNAFSLMNRTHQPVLIAEVIKRYQALVRAEFPVVEAPPKGVPYEDPQPGDIT